MATNADAIRLTKLILLIDGENLDSKYAAAIRAKVGELGTMIEGRVYGKADNGRMAGWRKSPDAAGLMMIDVPTTSKKKNAADFRLVVEAMDLIHTRNLDVLCIGSSDGDFSALATRIKAQSLALYGFGESKAADRYQSIYDGFFDCAKLRIDRENSSKIHQRLATAEKKAAPRQTGTSAPKPPTPAPVRTHQRPAPLPKTPARLAKRAPQPLPKTAPSKPTGTVPDVFVSVPLNALLDAIKKTVGADGWSHFRDLGHRLSRSGYKKNQFKLPTLRSEHGDAFEVEQRGTEKYIRAR